MSELTVLTDASFWELVIESQMPDDLSARVAFGSFEIDPAAHHELPHSRSYDAAFEGSN